MDARGRQLCRTAKSARFEAWGFCCAHENTPIGTADVVAFDNVWQESRPDKKVYDIASSGLVLDHTHVAPCAFISTVGNARPSHVDCSWAEFDASPAF